MARGGGALVQRWSPTADRIVGFLDPWGNPAARAISSSRATTPWRTAASSGSGLGASRARWLFLPNAHTDFIFAIIGEETGLVGALAVVGLFVALAVTGWTGGPAGAPDRFGRMLAAGITAWLSFQALVNIGGVLGVLPITGIALPFISFGSTALIACMGAMGILVNIAQSGVTLKR